MEINMKEWAQDIIAAKEVKCLPVLFFPFLKLSGGTVPEVVHSAELETENMVGIVKRFPQMIAAITSMDLTVEAETFGCAVRFTATEAPAVTGPALADRGAIEELLLPALDRGRGPLFIEAARAAAERIVDRPTFGGMLGPFSLACVLMELSDVMRMTRKDPEAIHTLLEKCTEYSIEYAKAFKEAGANGIFLAEPTAGLLLPDKCEEFSSRYVKQLVDAVQDDRFFIVLHNCGRTTKQVPSMVGTGAKGYHFGNAVDMADILPQIPGDLLVFGNVDPSGVLAQGTPEYVKQQTLELLEKMRPYPNFVLSSGCDLPYVVPIENLDAFFGALEQFNAAR